MANLKISNKLSYGAFCVFLVDTAHRDGLAIPLPKDSTSYEL